MGRGPPLPPPRSGAAVAAASAGRGRYNLFCLHCGMQRARCSGVLQATSAAVETASTNPSGLILFAVAPLSSATVGASSGRNPGSPKGRVAWRSLRRDDALELRREGLAIWGPSP